MTESAEVVVRAGSSQPSHCCVVLSPPEGDPPAALLRGLRARSVEVIAAADAPQVMVALARQACDICILCGEQSAWANSPLVDAIRTFHPRLALWCYGPAEGKVASELRRLTPSRPPRQTRQADACAPRPSKAADSAVDVDHDAPAKTLAANRVEHDDEPLLSGEELRMLLADAWEPDAQAVDGPDAPPLNEPVDEDESWREAP